MRAQAIILFGNLSAFGDGPSKQPFLEQIHSNFVSLLLHLNDPEDEVKKVLSPQLIFSYEIPPFCLQACFCRNLFSQIHLIAEVAYNRPIMDLFMAIYSHEHRVLLKRNGLQYKLMFLDLHL